MGTSRKFHTKTRNGCTNCKKRRVKCNLQAPQCHHCKRRGERCSFEFNPNNEKGNDKPKKLREVLSSESSDDDDDDDDYVNDDDNDKKSKNNSKNKNHGDKKKSISSIIQRKEFENLKMLSPSQWPALEIEQSQLRWHYDTCAAQSLALLSEDPRRVQLIWKGEVPLKAGHEPWLDHACMAISALHICHLEPPNPEDYYTAAFKNYRDAVVAFPKAVKDMNPQNSVSILSFSLLILMFQLGISCVPGAGPMSHALPDIDAYNAMCALRGTWMLIDQLSQHLEKSHLSALFTHRKFLRFEVLDENHEKMIETLTKLNETIEYGQRGDDDRQVCGQAITVLRFWFSIMAANLPTSWLTLLWWPAGVLPEFLQLLKDRDPMASIIFCYWCAGVYRFPVKWYLEGWAQRMLKSMLDLLGPEWQFAVEWPVNEIFPEQGQLQAQENVEES